MSHVQLNSYNNAWYSPKASGLKCFIWYFVNILFFKNAWHPLSSLKVWVLQLFGAKIGKGVVLKPGISIKYPWLLQIGNDSWIGEGVWIDNLTYTTIGSNVCISQGAMLLTGNHNYKKSSFDLITGEIVLEDGVWIGAKSVVCPGIVCKTHAVLSVNSVATQDLEPFTIYQGNPARAIRKRVIQSNV